MEKKIETFRIETFSWYLGIDVGSTQHAYCLYRGKEKVARSFFANSTKGLKELLTCLKDHKVEFDKLLSCLEHTGVYGQKVCRVLYGEGSTVWLVSAARLKGVSMEVDRRKTDAVDAEKIGSFAYRFADQCRAYRPESKELRALKDWCRLRRQLVNQRVRLVNQRKMFEQQAIQTLEVGKLYKELIQTYEEQLLQIEQKINALIESTDCWEEQRKWLMSIPGIGSVTARKLLVVTQGFSRMNNHKQLASYGGTAPFERSSGKHQPKRRISRRADPELKKLLTTAVMCTIKPGGYFHEYYHILLKVPGRKPLQAINMLRNRLLKIAVTLVRKKELFDRELYKENCLSWQEGLT